jgi:predicted nucleic acid-binding protein
VLIVDANVLVGAMNRRDKHHERMRALLDGRDDQFVVTPYVVAEVAHLVQKFAGPSAEIQFMEAVRDGVFRQEELSVPDMERVVELMRQFQDFPLGAADASIIAVAERLKIRDIASIDGHFRAVRPRGVDFFTLLP